MPQAQKLSPTPTRRTAPATHDDAWGLIDKLHMLVFGQSGTGKTRFASTFPAPILWLVCSGSDRPGELKSIDTPANRKRITAKMVRSFEAFDSLLTDAGKFETVVLDHASGLADLVLSKIIGKPVPEQKGWGLASQQQYGQQSLQMKEAFRKLLDLPAHVVILAQERTFNAKDDGGASDQLAPSVGAALTPSLTGWLNPACDYVVQTFKRPVLIPHEKTIGSKTVTTFERGKGVEYCLRCDPHDVIMTKFRTPGDTPPEPIVNPTFAKVLAAVNGETE